MARKVASPKQTGGGGFLFEDKVAAYFLSLLLIAEPPLDPEIGTISRIDFQTRVDGWLLDDLLLTLKTSTLTHRCAFSLKSNSQFTSTSVPKDFALNAWEQFLHETTSPFNKVADFLGFIISPPAQATSNALNALLHKARVNDPGLLPQRIMKKGYASSSERKLFASFACPPQLAGKHAVTPEKTGELLSRIRILEFDFEAVNSKSLREAAGYCRKAIHADTIEEGTALWEKLLLIASDRRTHGGYIDLQSLVDSLRQEFHLNNYPFHNNDWLKLREHTKNTLSGIPGKIGNTIVLNREADLDSLNRIVNHKRVAAIIGPSGSGKTVLSKMWAEKHQELNKILWINARSLETHTFGEFEKIFNLRHQLSEILTDTADKSAYVIIDGLDRVFSHTAFSNFSILLRMLRLNQDSSPWRIIIPAQSEEWERIRARLLNAEISCSCIESFSAKELTSADLEPLLVAFPSLRHLVYRPHLRVFIMKPKILDLLACRSNSVTAIDSAAWVGESDFIDWLWKTEVSKEPDGIARARFTEELAEKQAESLDSAISISEFTVSDLGVLGSLISDRLCQVNDERISFCHDLYADWARVKILIGKKNRAIRYIHQILASPLWHKAIRLYGLHLLEQNKDIISWRTAFDAICTDDKKFSLGQDLLLESVLFASDPLPLLEKLLPDLIAGEGILLRRLLIRFLHVTTYPHDAFVRLVSETHPDLDTLAASMYRVPQWHYWLPMIDFLRKNMQHVIVHASLQVATIADTWLRRTPPDWPLRKEAAELAMTIVESLSSEEEVKSKRIPDGHLSSSMIRAALASAHELPERVADYVLEASRRSEFTRPIETMVSPPFSFSTSALIKADMTLPWPDGPYMKVDMSFKDECLQTDALHPLIVANAALAREVMLALLIEEPRIHDPYRERYSLNDYLEIDPMLQWCPPFYDKGPFLFFLRSQPIEGLELIIRLVNFAVDRLTDSMIRQGREMSSLIIRLPGFERTWRGGPGVYYWYQHYARCPNPVAAAMMALEKWCYEKMVSGESLDEAIESILSKSNNVAFAGLLSAVGRKNPELFVGKLRLLLGVPEFYYWEMQNSIKSTDYLLLGWSMKGKAQIEAAREWYNMTHRKRELNYIARILFLTHPEMKAWFTAVKSEWLQRLDTIEEDNEFRDYMRNIIPHFERDNYTQETLPDGDEGLRYEPPAHLRLENERVLSDVQTWFLFTTFPSNCRRLLDGEFSLERNKVEQFWAQLQFIAHMDLSELQDERMENAVKKEDAICGGISVLMMLHPDWLEAEPEKKLWCIEEIHKTMALYPRSELMDFEEDVSGWQWHSFCAGIIPSLWAEEPDSPVFRDYMARLAVHRCYRTVRILFSATSRHRRKLGANFKKLQHFLLRWAVIRWRLKMARFSIDPGPAAIEWINNSYQAFVDNTLSPEIPSWDSLIHIEFGQCKDIPEEMKKRLDRAPGIDRELVLAAYSWLPLLRDAHSPEERKEWISFWKSTVLWSMQVFDDDEEPMISEWDVWVLANGAHLIAEMKTAESPEELWKPILELGATRYERIPYFFRFWFRTLDRVDTNIDHFIMIWRAMVDWAFSSPKWDFETVRNYYALEKMWSCCMGMKQDSPQISFDFIVIQSSNEKIWNAARRPIIRRMKEDYYRWASVHLKRPGCMISFMNFLKEPAAEDLLCQGIGLIDDAVAQGSESFWQEREFEATLAALLDNTWSTHSEILCQDSNALRSFNILLICLIDRQNSLAMVLSDKMTKATR